MKLRYIAIWLCLLVIPVYAAEIFRGTWDSINITTDQTKPLFFSFKAEQRLYYNAPVRNEILLQASSGFRIYKKLALAFAYETFQSLEDSKRMRQVLWEQSTYDLLKSNPLDIILRSRFEEQHSSLFPGLAWRFRQQILLASSDLGKGKVIPTVYDEFFFNLNHPPWVSAKTFAQNRFFIGARIPFNKNISILLGYLNINHYLTDLRLEDHLLNTALEIKIA
jgi:hypothetical protein